MARIRTIKPEFWSSPGHEGLDPWARLLYIAMWNWADDFGRGVAHPKELAAFAFPNDDTIGSTDIRRMLGGIRRAFGVEFYTVGGRPFFSIPTWDKHQKIDKRSQPRYPAPDEGDPYDPDPIQAPDQRKTNGSTVHIESSENPAESSPSPRRGLDAGNRKWEEGNRKKEDAAPGGAASRAHTRTRTRGTTTLQELADSAAIPEADRIVRDWRAVNDPQNDYRPQALREIRKVVDGMVRDGCNHDRIRDALDEFHRRPDLHSPKLLPRLYDDAVRAVARTVQGRPASTAPSKSDTYHAMAEQLRAEEQAAEQAQLEGRRGPIGIVIEGRSA